MCVCVKFKIAEKTLIPVIAFNIHHSLELLYTLIVYIWWRFCNSDTQQKQICCTSNTQSHIIKTIFFLFSLLFQCDDDDDDICRLEARIVKWFLRHSKHLSLSATINSDGLWLLQNEIQSPHQGKKNIFSIFDFLLKNNQSFNSFFT